MSSIILVKIEQIQIHNASLEISPRMRLTNAAGVDGTQSIGKYYYYVRHSTTRLTVNHAFMTPQLFTRAIHTTRAIHDIHLISF